jgi:thiamine kinase-like enzyme
VERLNASMELDMKVYRTFPVLIAISSSLCAVAKVPEEVVNMAADILGANKTELKLRRGRRPGVFTVTNGDNKYVLKVFGEALDKDMRSAELHYVSLFSTFGVGPKFIGKGKGDNCYVCEWVRGRTLSRTDVQDAEKMKKLASAIRRLHSERSEFRAQSVDERIAGLLRRIEKRKIALPTGYLKKCEEVRSCMSSTEKKIACCHGGLSPRNIIFGDDGNVYFINVYKAGDANIYDELGYVISSCWIDGENRDIFLTEYFGRKPKQTELDLISSSQRRADLMTSAILFERSESRNDKKIDMPTRIEKLDDMVKSRDGSLDPKSIDDVQAIAKSHDRKKIRACAVGFYKRFRGDSFD